jgi:hypothetical protein
LLRRALCFPEVDAVADARRIHHSRGRR